MSIFQTLFAIAVSATPAIAYYGNMTYFHQGLGACGKNHDDTNAVVALSADDYGSDENPNLAAVCGQWIKITAKGRTSRGQVWDKCPGNECPKGSIDVSPIVFQNIADLTVGRLEVNWEFENSISNAGTSITQPAPTLSSAGFPVVTTTVTVTVTANP